MTVDRRTVTVDRRIVTVDRRIAVGLIALTIATALLVVLDVGGPARVAVTLGFTLVAPGLALSLLMGPMSIEARLLVALAGSAALATVVSVALAAAGGLSGGLGLTALAAIVSMIALPVARRRGPPADPTDMTAGEPPDHRTDLPQETARRLR